jgi:hypothetical protein
MREGEAGQGAVEYIGVLALVALVVTAVAVASPLPQRVATAFRDSVCAITLDDCAPAEPAEGVEEADQAEELDLQPIAQVSEPSTWDGEPESDGWRRCPALQLCVFGGINYEDLIWIGVVEDPDEFGLPFWARDRMRSWVNNTPWDLCGQNTILTSGHDTVQMPGRSHPGGQNRAMHAIGGDEVDLVGPCEDYAWIDPDPLVPEAEGGPDCPHPYLCLYDDPQFRNELTRIRVPVGNWRIVDIDIELPEGIADRVSSWAHNGDLPLCGYDSQTSPDLEIPMSMQGINSDRGRAQDAWVGLQQNDRIDHIDACDSWNRF